MAIGFVVASLNIKNDQIGVKILLIRLQLWRLNLEAEVYTQNGDKGYAHSVLRGAGHIYF